MRGEVRMSKMRISWANKVEKWSNWGCHRWLGLYSKNNNDWYSQENHERGVDIPVNGSRLPNISTLLVFCGISSLYILQLIQDTLLRKWLLHNIFKYSVQTLQSKNGFIPQFESRKYIKYKWNRVEEVEFRFFSVQGYVFNVSLSAELFQNHKPGLTALIYLPFLFCSCWWQAASSAEQRYLMATERLPVLAF